MMNIAQVSEKFDITKETLHYWERSGLLPEIPRNESGYRDYGEHELNWIFFIQAMRKAGVSIEALVEFVELYRLKTDTRAAQKQLLVEQRDKLEQQKREIEKTLNYLNYKLDNFENHVLNYEIEKLHYKIDKKDQ